MNTVTEATNLDQTQLGLYPKFKVSRTDGKDAPGSKHENDEYFVLNLTTDRHAIPALNAYAKACEAEYPMLASDLRAIVRNSYQRNDEMVLVPETTLPNGTVVPSFMVGKYHCSKSLEGVAVINPDNKPWSRINYHDARKACSDAGYSLITELQYLAITYQITQQDANWTGGKVGEGEIYRGLHKGTVDEAQDGHYESSDPIERRWHVLANGEVVFDFSGNIYSWVFDDVQGDENGIIAKKISKKSPTVTTPPYGNREHGIGDTSTGSGDWSGSALIRGGFWGSRVDAGVFCLGGGWPDRGSSSVGFRCTKSL